MNNTDLLQINAFSTDLIEMRIEIIASIGSDNGLTPTNNTLHTGK